MEGLPCIAQPDSDAMSSDCYDRVPPALRKEATNFELVYFDTIEHGLVPYLALGRYVYMSVVRTSIGLYVRYIMNIKDMNM